ncbi:hypothetical protein T265_06667 [Opisthorchis viverrini]|uniref:Uncharacterized protein n=1 Tax=Opisthorchis viverrini TaxID=6198 RepID=A0A074ZRJ2_OPIVI|nr:hypothetical protein T265_06667 [Opisthorchis viverrini]KER25970.1 hypothetical protein T265_06667 [Opisthorchis viverrini]
MINSTSARVKPSLIPANLTNLRRVIPGNILELQPPPPQWFSHFYERDAVASDMESDMLVEKLAPNHNGAHLSRDTLSCKTFMGEAELFR